MSKINAHFFGFLLSQEELGDGGALAADHDATVGGGVDEAAVGGIELNGAYRVVDFGPEVGGDILDAAVATLCHDGEVLDFPRGGLGGG